MYIHGFIHHTHKHQLSSFEGALTSPQQQQSRAECDASVASRRDVSVALISCSFAFFSSNTQSTARARRDVAQAEAITKTRRTLTHTRRPSPKSSMRVCVRGTERCDQWGLCKEYANLRAGGTQMCRHIYTHTHTHIYTDMCTYACVYICFTVCNIMYWPCILCVYINICMCTCMCA